MTVQIDVELNEKWRDDIGELYTEFKAMDGASVDLDADVSRASQKVGALKGEVETLTSGHHEIDVDANIDHDSIQESVDSLNELDVDNVDLNLGDLGDLNESISITTDIDDDDPILKALTNDKELETRGTVKWHSRGGHGPSSSSGTINWDSDVSATELIDELKAAKNQAKAAGATTIDYEIKPKNGTSSEFIDAVKNNRNDSTNITHSYTEYTDYQAHVDHRSFEETEAELERLKRGMDQSGLTEIKTKVCVERCDDWKKNLNNIYKDLDAIEDWNKRNGDIEISLAGNLGELEDTIDAIEESDLDLSGQSGGGDTEVERMLSNAQSEVSPYEAWKQKHGIGTETDTNEKDTDSTTSPGWTKEDRRWMGSGVGRAISTETSAQLDRLDNTLDSLGIEGQMGGNEFTPDDIKISDEMKSQIVEDKFGKSVANEWPEFRRDEAESVAQKRAFADITREFDSTSGYGDGVTKSTKDYSDHGEFGFPDTYTKQDGGPYSPKRWLESSSLNKDVTAGEIRSRGKDKPFGAVEVLWENSGEFSVSERFEESIEDADPDKNIGQIANELTSKETSHPGFANVLDKEHGTNPFTQKEQDLLGRFGVDMPSSQYFGSEDDSAMANWFTSVTARRTGGNGFGNFDANLSSFKSGGGTSDWGSILGFGGLPGFGSDGDNGSGGPGINSLKKLMPTMAKYWQLIALLSPMLITLAANAAGVAAAMGSIAVAGGAVIGLGLLGFGSNLADSMKEAQQRIKEFKKDLFATFKPTFQQFSPFTEAFMATAPIRVEPLAQSMKGLTEFVPTFNDAFDGLVSYAAEFIDVVVQLEPILSQLGMRFGSILGDLAIRAFKWLTQEAYKNQDVMIDVGKAIFSLIKVLYQFAHVLAYLTAIFSPIINMFAWVASFISERLVAAMIAGTMAVYGIATAVGVLSGAFSTLLSTSLASMASSIAAFAATAITSFLAAAEALAVLIAGQATLLTMTGAGIALAAAGVAAGYAAYKAIAPKGQASSLGGGGAGSPGFGGGGMGNGGGMGAGAGVGGGGGSKTVINVEGDISKASISDVEDAVEKNYSDQTTIEENRNPVN